MNKVRILPPEVISKIAAGEVIERPASVIKELMENSLDAGAQSLQVELQQAGKLSIRIKDTGTGISQEDIETVFHRHSTSKITTIDDLFNIHSLGFRGEALYSIAAIADVTLRSKTKEQDSGWEIHIRGGEKLGLRPVSMETGTELEVKELFFNTPARRKFLKSNTTEIHQILNTFIPYTLLYPNVRFSLKHENKVLLDLKPTDGLRQRAAATLNLQEKHLLEAAENLAAEHLSVRVLLGDINIVRSRRDLQFIFVNQRPVQSRNIGFHLNEVYRLILPSGNYPFFCVYIEIPTDQVDVNIHPTKREVKIKDEQTLTSLLRHLCENTLMSAGGTKIVTASPFEPAGSSPAKPAFPASLSRALSEMDADEILSPEIFEAATGNLQTTPTEQYSFPQSDYLSLAGETLFQQKQESLFKRLNQARYIGALLNKFLLFEVERSLLVIDQHAAQERITFEHFVMQMQKGQVEVQHLLSPYLIKLSPQDLLVWEEAKGRLDEVGFSSTQFDGETIAVHTYPVLLRDPAKAVRDILSGDHPARCDHETIARRACRASIMAGDSLSPEQALSLREQLAHCRDPFTCPHGRPTVVELLEDFLDKQFLRT